MKAFRTGILSAALGVAMALPAHAEVNWRQFEGTSINGAFFTANYIGRLGTTHGEAV